MHPSPRIAPLALLALVASCGDPTPNAPPPQDAAGDPSAVTPDVATDAAASDDLVASPDAAAPDATTPDATVPPPDSPPTDAPTPPPMDAPRADAPAPPPMDAPAPPPMDAPRADAPAPPPDAAVTVASAVWTNRNDNGRTGATLTETRLNTTTVAPGRFGLLFTRAVRGQIYAQPLYVPGVNVPGRGPRNVVYVATEHNDVYAFDADDPAAAAPYWTVNLGPSVPVADVMDQGPCVNITPEIGITSTPVIDLAAGTIFVLAKTREGDRHVQRLHALDITTGRPRAGSPTVIEAQVRGTGGGADDEGVIRFDALRSNNRPGLALHNGVVYAAFASHCDRYPFHGWILAYDAATLRQRAVYNNTPNGDSGGIWQSGVAPSIDESGDLFFVSGDGTATPATTPPQLGNSVGRVRLAGPAFTTVDFFTPFDHVALTENDHDLGSTGVLLLPRTRLAVIGSKEGILYVLDRDNMGRFRAGGDTQIVQRFRVTLERDARNIHGGPVYWDSPEGPRIYIWGEEDRLKSFRFEGGRFNPTPVAVSPMEAAEGMPGGILSVSANGSAPGSGVVWSSMPIDANANEATVPGVLRAFDAANVARELWNSMADPRDAVGMFAKFSPPTVANGRVYLATFSNRLNVYGLR